MHELENQKLVEPKYLEMESKYLEMESHYVELRKTLRFLLGSINLCRWLGYGLLVLALFDVIEIFIPPKFMNHTWEFHTMEALVGRVSIARLRCANGIPKGVRALFAQLRTKMIYLR